MTLGLVGKKCGMTRIFTEDGVSIPVTVIEVLPNKVTQLRTVENDGYNAIQVTTGKCKRSRVNKAIAGHYAKAGVEQGSGLWEFRLSNEESLDKFSLASETTLEIFSIGDMVDVRALTRGKGFAGVIKRYHFSSQDATHGNSLSHRAPGSIGQRQSPGKVFKGKKMSGHMGNAMRTVLSQPIVKLDSARNLIMVRGAVPGAPGGDVVIRPAVKKRSLEDKKKGG